MDCNNNRCKHPDYQLSKLLPEAIGCEDAFQDFCNLKNSSVSGHIVMFVEDSDFACSDYCMEVIGEPKPWVEYTINNPDVINVSEGNMSNVFSWTGSLGNLGFNNQDLKVNLQSSCLTFDNGGTKTTMNMLSPSVALKTDCEVNSTGKLFLPQPAYENEATKIRFVYKNPVVEVKYKVGFIPHVSINFKNKK
jgi:hypothetical protein